MISKAKLKELSAFRMAKVCEEAGLFVVEGPKMCGEALQAGLPMVTVCATAEWLALHPLPAGVDTHEVGPAELERLSQQRTPNQVWMLIDRDFRPLCAPAEGGLMLALDHLQDPGNLGTIIRTADWFGVRRVLCSEGCVSCFNPKVVQATMGGLFRTTIETVDLTQRLREERQKGRAVYGAMLDGENVYRADLQRTDAILVIGNESRGITPEVQAQLSHRLLIPNLGGTCESLNAGVAAAVLLSEFMRK